MSKNILPKYRNIVQNRILQHILFWSASFIILIYIFKVSVRPQKIDIIYTFFFTIPLLFVVYINSILLIPRVLSKRYYIQYLFWVLILMVIGSQFYLQLFIDWIDALMPGYFIVAYYTAYDYVLFMAIFILMSSLLKLAKSWFRLAELEKENQHYALKSLQAKVNPHFFFNALNTLYGMSLKKNDELPEAILSLSNLMRYSLYEADKDKVPLSDEIAFLQNFIDLQKRRIANSVRVTMNVIGDASGRSITPHIFLPFVENAFKHHGDSTSADFVIFVEFRIMEKELLFKCQNSIVGKVENEAADGLGLVNTRDRLLHLYPKRHELTIEECDTFFSVYLNLKR